MTPAVRGTVRATVIDPNGTRVPVANASVVFSDLDGTVVKQAMTDASGSVQAEMLPGASVTSILRTNNVYRIQTVLKAKPGDNLVLGNEGSDFTPAGNFTVSFPAIANATLYGITSPCGTQFVNAPPVTLPMYNHCKKTKMEIVIVAESAVSTLGFITKPDVTFVSGGSITITDGYQPARSFTASYTNLIPLITGISYGRGIPDAAGWVDLAFRSMPSATTVMALLVPQGSAAHISTGVTRGNTSQSIREMISGTASTYEMDLNLKLLPWLTPSYDKAARKLVVSLDSTGTTTAKPDMFRISARYVRTDAAGANTVFDWTFFAPEPTDITFPALPGDLASIPPTANEKVGVTSAVMIEVDTVAGYDAVRNDLNTAFNLYVSGSPPTGVARVSGPPSIRFP